MSDDLFDALERGPSGSLGSTPIEFSGVDGTNLLLPQTAQTEMAVAGHMCPECGKFLKTKSGFSRHMTTHKINGYNFRKPLEGELSCEMHSIFQAVMNDIRNEPAVGVMGAQKMNFLDSFCTNTSSSETSLFVNCVFSKLLEIVLTKSKVMPSAQYEDMLAKVNQLLCEGDFFEDLRVKMVMCVPLEKRLIPSTVLDRLLWRIVTKISLQMQLVVFKKMKKVHHEAHSDFSMSDSEKGAYKEHIKKILRSVYKFGYKSDNNIWQLRCKCLCKRFLIFGDHGNSPSHEEILDSNMWQNNISLSESCVNLFIGLEKIVQNLQARGIPYTADTIFENVTSLENIIILCDFRKLTQGLLSEDVALTFLQELVRCIVSLSAKWDAKKKKETASTNQKMMNVATRSDLKRNPKKKTEPASSSGGPEKAVPSTSGSQATTEVSRKTTQHKEPKATHKASPTVATLRRSSRASKPLRK